MKKLLFLVPLALFGVLLLFLGKGLNLNPREVPSPLIGKPAPAFTLPVLADPAKSLGRQDLLEFVDDRTGSGAILIASQLPVAKWHEYINEPTLADAILDRIVHRAHKIEMHGDSMRKKRGLNDGED